MTMYVATIKGEGISEIAFIKNSMEEIISSIESEFLEEKHHIVIYPLGGTVSDGVELGTVSWDKETGSVAFSMSEKPMHLMVHRDGVCLSCTVSWCKRTNSAIIIDH